jgi:chromosome segregation protein
VLAERNRRERLVADSERAVRGEHAARTEVGRFEAAVAEADAAREAADRARREADRARSQAQEDERRARVARRGAPQGARAGRGRRAPRAAARRAAGRGPPGRAIGARARRAVAPDPRPRPAVRERGRARGAGRAPRRGAQRGGGRRRGARRGARGRAAGRPRRGEGVAAELRACAKQEAEVQGHLRARGEAVTQAEVRAQRARDQAADAETELRTLAERLGLAPEPATEPLADAEAQALRARIEKLARRREQLGPVNPLAGQEYAEAVAHVEELERQREDLETALRELRGVIRETDRQIRDTFAETFEAAARNFEELAATLFPGGRGRLRLVREDSGPRPVLGGEEAPAADAGTADPAGDDEGALAPEDLDGVEIEITPHGKTMKRLTLMSGGEKSMTAIAFLFAVFLARPCPFYILDEVEAALDDVNIGRFLDLLRAYADRAQFIVVTHQRRTMEAADTLYGVSMGDDGVSKVVSRRLEPVAEAVA